MAGPLVEVEGVKVRFGNFWALDGANLNVQDGELRVLIGANGAGKSTLLDVMCGKTPVVEGDVRVQGKSLIGLTEPAIVEAGVGRKFQTPAVFGELTVWQNIEVARRPGGGVMRDVFRFPRWRDTSEVADTLEMVGLLEHREAPAQELAHGQFQWLELGMLLMQGTRLLLLDEPTAGMTASETRQTAAIIRSLRGRRTIIVVEHDMAFVRDICETITVLHQGRVIAEGPADEVENDPDVIDAYLGGTGVASAAAE